MSNKLTFSLVFVLMFAFAAMSAFGQVQVVVPTAEAPGVGEFLIVTPGTPVNGITANTATGDDPPNGATILDSPNITTNLDDLLAFGGLIELSIASTAAATEADVAKLKHGIVISEIMWGLNSGGLTAQWIEIYNHNIASPGDITISFSTTSNDKNELGVKMQAAGDDGDLNTADDVYTVYVDQVSTINNLGASWAPPGNGGNSARIAGPPSIEPTPLVSMYRKINLAADGSAAYKKTSAGALDGLGDGTAAGSWAASAGRGMYQTGNFIASPGGVHVSTGGVTVVTAKTPGSISATGIIINEVRNDTSDANLDWIELFYNGDAATDTAINIDGYSINIVVSKVDADGKATGVAAAEKRVADFPAHKMSPGDYFVVYNRHPADTILAAGIDVAEPRIRRINKGASHAFAVDGALNLPSTGKFLLVLRTATDQDNEPDAVKDYAGNGFFTSSGRERDADHFYNTSLFPLNGWTAPGDQADSTANTFASTSQTWARETVLNDDGVYWPDSRADNRMHKDDWDTHSYMGVGYDRDVDTAAAPGTPGYPNVAVNVIADDRENAANKTPYAFGGSVTISEVMYDAGPRWNLVQWIELYNSSMTETINLAGWEMEIRNESTDVESYVDSSFVFDAMNILPNQTLLLVSGTGANDVDSTRVYNLNQRHRRALGLATRDSRLLSAEGFALKLWARVNVGGQTVLMLHDQAGNVDVDGAARIHMWDLPERGDVRMSIVRQYGTRALDGNGPDEASDGKMETSWRSSDIAGAGISFYGHRNDVSTPGYRLGGPLPVELASFRPVRNAETGHVQIQWVTESELNNAGFNVLRAESKTGEFKVVNVKGIIAGHGTTSEKHVYTFTDTTAKPNVVYYYQIEDISLDGKRTTLRTTHLRGNVSAAGKVTTTWGDLKTQN